MKEEWYCFIQEANFYIINKQLLILKKYQIVKSCLGIALSYSVTTVGVSNKPVQNTQWYRLIQLRSVSSWPILYPTSVKEFLQRLTKFISGFRKCHSVSSNIWDVSIVTTLLILMPLTRKCFGWIHLWLNVLFSFIREKINKQLRRSMRCPL